ncbi:MAG: exonuclease [Streptosporangiales bacterium]|nr:exonuclease [Streptosporangiales bacterium]
MKRDVYISVDIEADGPIPGPYSMLSLGAAFAGTYDADGYRAPDDPREATWYAELRPISESVVPAALAVTGLDRDQLVRAGEPPARAMAEFAHWVEATGRRYGGAPVFAAYPVGFDWMFAYWYLMSYAGHSPFGHSRAVDIKTLYAARAGRPISHATKRHMPRHLHAETEHTHNALDDAVEQGELLANIMRWR